MTNPVKYAVGFFAFTLLIAALITLLERLNGSDASYIGPCTVGLLGAGLGLWAWSTGSCEHTAPVGEEGHLIAAADDHGNACEE